MQYSLRSLLTILLIPLLITCTGANALAAEGSSLRSAFEAAEDKDWDKALSYAKKQSNPTLFTLIEWLYLLDSDANASIEEIDAFMRNHAQWPDQRRLQINAERQLQDTYLSDQALSGWFMKHAPIIGIAKIAYADLLMRRGERMNSPEVIRLVREAWIDGDFSRSEEERIRSAYRSILKSKEHWQRADRLVWEHKTSDARTMLPFLSVNQQAIITTRIGLISGAKNVESLLSKVPSSLRNTDPGLMHSRMIWRAKKGLDSGVREMLRAAPNSPPYPEKWWPQRERQVRDAIYSKDYSTARALLSGHGLIEGSAFAEASWLSGWLSLEYLNDPADAARQFERMHEGVNYPVSKARAAYWLGRALEKKGDSEARSWYTKASRHPTTFYGQLAVDKLNGDRAELPAPFNTSPASRVPNEELMHAAQLTWEAGEKNLTVKLLNHIIDETHDTQQTAAIVQRAQEIGGRFLGVKASKRALRDDIYLTEISYPWAKTGEYLPIEQALAHAIIRQESEFDPDARSRADAQGMMQLLPSTAREVARKIEMPYRSSGLYDEEYNIMLGSEYLSRLIDSKDGSYVLAIASYNAGPGNVSKWVDSLGYPGRDLHSAINWIEHIPFGETRNYVQRVMENLQVYRDRHYRQHRRETPLAIAEDLRR